MKRIRLFLIVAAVAAALTLPASAKGGFNIVTVAGPDWYGEIEITDPDLLPSLDMSHFMNLDRPIDAPAQVGRGYLITRGYVEGSERHMFDRIVYFPGSPGYAYYLEIVNGAGPMDGNWYTVSDEGEQALAAGIAKHGVRLPKSVLRSPSEQTAGGAVANAGELADVDVAAPPAGGAVVNTAELEGIAVAEPVMPDVGLTKVFGPPPFNVRGPEAVGLLVGAVLMGSLAGWALRGMRLWRTQSTMD